MKVEKAKNLISSMIVTDHSVTRFSERTKFYYADANFLKAYLINVLVRGIHMKKSVNACEFRKNTEFTSQVRNRKAIVFGNHVYIFAEDYSALVTVLNLVKACRMEYSVLQRKKNRGIDQRLRQAA